MTLENFEYRTNPFFLRNQFSKYSAKFGIPAISKPFFTANELTQLRLLRFDKVKNDNAEHRNRIVHFFEYDYLFEKVWQNPEQFIEILLPYRGVLTPDFSMYIEMPLTIQLYNTFRNRWCGAYFVEKGLRVVPTVSWGTEESFDFCFEGIEKGSVVAVSTYMFHAHGNHADQKEIFMAGYREMLKRIEPEYIICYSEPFPEMQGNIIYVNYDLSSWRHMQDDIVPPESIKHSHGILTFPEKYAMIRKTGYVCKGGGSANGGGWIPKKEKDKRFIGKPGEIKETTLKYGEKYETLIGKDGRAAVERHWTDHNQPYAHTNPHDHIFDWSKGFPNPHGEVRMYPDGNYPDIHDVLGDGTGEKAYHREKTAMIFEFDNFESISDFKWSMKYGGETEFEYGGSAYSIVTVEDDMYIVKANHPETLLISADVEKILDYLMDDGKKLREVITQVDVISRLI